MLSSLLIPESAGLAAQFAEDFKVWCFGYDPATGELEWGYVWMLFIQPILLIGITLLVWWRPLQEARSVSSTRFGPYIGISFLIACGLGLGLVSIGDFDKLSATGAPTFPGERIRTHHIPLPFTLVNQDGREINPIQSEKVVLITGVYASCGYTCPLILAQTKRVLDKLSEAEKEELLIVAITLDPDRDTPEVLKAMTEAQRLTSPLFNAVTGNPDNVNEILDRYGFARTRDPETGIIDHTNLFILIDRAGKIAFRFSLGEIQEDWLEKALHLVIAEDKEKT